MGGKLEFGELLMHPSGIEIEVMRSTGSDVFLERDLRANAIAVGGQPSIHFDIPQGIYNRLTISLSFDADAETEAEFEDDLGDLLDDLSGGIANLTTEEELGELILDYLEDDPAFVYSGTYVRAGEELELLLVINDPFVLNTTAVNGKGSREIALEKGRGNRASLHFDVNKWFSIVPEALVEKSPVGIADGKKYVLIHKKLNPGLFNMLYNRIEQYTTLVVNE